MIVRQVRGNVFTSGCRNIAFGVNVEGFNTDGFAGMIAGRYWPALANTGTRTMGQVLTHRAGQYTFHALVCHRIDIGGFHQTPRVITECLNAIAVPDDTEIACVMVGGGPMGQAAGADTNAILEGIARSSKRVAVYSL